jgi:hypothetical protein
LRGIGVLGIQLKVASSRIDDVVNAARVRKCKWNDSNNAATDQENSWGRIFVNVGGGFGAMRGGTTNGPAVDT